MIAWMVTVDSRRGVVADEDVLLGFSDALDEVRGTTGAATGLNAGRGVLSATFTVEVDDVQQAVDQALTIFGAALERIGVRHITVAHVDAEVIEREPAVA